MGSITLYTESSGEIQLNYQGDRVETIIELYPDLEFITGIFPSSEYYVQNGLAVPRPVFNISLDKTTLLADNIDVINITGIPNNTVIDITNTETLEKLSETVSISDTFSTNDPGTYIMEFKNFPYISLKETIYAT